MIPLHQRTFDIALLALSELAVFAVAAELHGPVRWVLVFLTLVLVPGAAVVPRLGLDDVATYIGLAVVLSVAIGTVGAMLMVWAHFWHPLLLGSVLVVAGCAVMIYDIQKITKALARTEQSWV